MRLVHCAALSLRLAFGLACALVCATSSAQTGYTITALGGLGSGGGRSLSSDARGLNSKGQVVGYSRVYNAARNYLGYGAFLYTGGKIATLGNFGTDAGGYGYSQAQGINSVGQVAGYSTVYDAQHHPLGYRAFRYANGQLTNLGTFGTAADGLSGSYAQAINEVGMAAGYSYVYDAGHQYKGVAAFTYANNTLTKLSNFGTDATGSGYSYAYGINTVGQVVGSSEVYDAQHNSQGSAAFIAFNGTMTKLGNLGTDTNGKGFSRAFAVNNAGDAVGDSNVYNSAHTGYGERAVLFNNNQVIDLGALSYTTSGASNSEAHAINDAGKIVGYSTTYDAGGNYTGQSATLFQYGYEPIDLNNYLPLGSGWHLTDATGINNRGQICGTGTHNGNEEAFLLTPYQPGDFNNDGNADMLWRSSTSNDLVLALMRGTSRRSNQYVGVNIPAEWQTGATPDLNGDGFSDLVWQNTKTGDIAFWLLNNGAYVGYGDIASAVPLEWKIVGSGDFNGDGFVDLVWQNQTTGDVAAWYLAGSDFFASGLLTPGVGSDWRVEGVGDMNGNGSPDLLWRNVKTGDLYVWLLNAGVFVSSVQVSKATPLNYHVAAVGDYNNDGFNDLVWQDSTSGDVYVWLMNGTTFVVSIPVTLGAGSTWHVVGPR